MMSLMPKQRDKYNLPLNFQKRIKTQNEIESEYVIHSQSKQGDGQQRQLEPVSYSAYKRQITCRDRQRYSSEG